MHASNLAGAAAGGGIDLTALNILGLDQSQGIYSVGGMRADLATLSESIVAVSATRSDLGAVANQLAYTVANLHSAVAAVTASRSTLTDADMAGEAQRFVTAKITTFAAASIVAQANSAPEAVLKLLDDSVIGAGSDGHADSGSGSGDPADGSGADPAGATQHAGKTREDTGSRSGDVAPAGAPRGDESDRGMTASAA
jgi:hypothetical protein